MHYIPGTTLLGSLAAAHRILRPEQQEQFAPFFLDDQIFYPCLYPAVFNESGLDFDTSNLPVMPLPKTAQSCKRFSDFKPAPDEDPDVKGHGIRDNLLDWAAFSLLSDEQQSIPALLAPLDKHAYCASCHQTMDRVSGYYRCASSNPQQKMKAQTRTRLQTRTGINRSWGVAEEGILYNREVFDEDMNFWGAVILPDGLVDDFTDFIKEANEEGVICIGTGRTRGLGQIEIEEPGEVKREDISRFRLRLSNFDEALKQRAQVADVKEVHNFYFAITLHSATILCDPFLRYHKTLDAATLRSLLKNVPEDVNFTQIYHSTGIQRITGWNDLWGTPRTNDYAIEMGSTFFFACSHKLDDDTLLNDLYTLEETGIGRRCSEGFGRICISDPFHLQGEQL